VEAESAIKQRWGVLRGVLDERQRRLLVGVEAKVRGRGGISAVAAATGVSRATVGAGLGEVEGLAASAAGADADAPRVVRVRRPGGGRKRLADTDPTLLPELLALVDPLTRGDPQSPLRWTAKSLRVLAAELRAQGHAVSHVLVGRLLKAQGYSLQGNAKVIEGSQSPDRDAQFEHINAVVSAALAAGQPAISVDTKKKELVGRYRNGGREWEKSGQPTEVKVHDFIDPELGRANPYGVYDLGADAGWVSVGTDHDTAAFAVQTIRRWWASMGSARYPCATELVITADGGGSNGHRVRLWKLELGRLAEETGLTIRVCHFPPGTSKWNRIEHRLFSFITMNWRGRPLVSHEVIVSLIAGTRTRSGLTVHAEIDPAAYPKGVVVTDAELAAVRLDRDDFHGDWNYSIRPGP
jgi:Rhodopirellula transposase DDE domain